MTFPTHLQDGARPVGRHATATVMWSSGTIELVLPSLLKHSNYFSGRKELHSEESTAPQSLFCHTIKGRDERKSNIIHT
jgi:hypothetical protein